MAIGALATSILVLRRVDGIHPKLKFALDMLLVLLGAMEAAQMATRVSRR
jgi:hypothetical protein